MMMSEIMLVGSASYYMIFSEHRRKCSLHLPLTSPSFCSILPKHLSFFVYSVIVCMILSFFYDTQPIGQFCTILFVCVYYCRYCRRCLVHYLTCLIACFAGMRGKTHFCVRWGFTLTYATITYRIWYEYLFSKSLKCILFPNDSTMFCSGDHLRQLLDEMEKEL